MAWIEQITTEAGIDRLVPEWKSLWEKVPDATPFQSPEWLLSWWKCFGNASPLVLAARNDNGLIAVLPLYFLQKPECRKLLPFGISLSDYLDALILPDHQALGEVLLCSLAGTTGWDECHIPDLRACAVLLSARTPSALSQDRSRGEPCPVLLLPNAVEGLREVVPRKTLRDLRQARHRAAATDGVMVEQADTTTVSAFMHEFFRLHETRWQRIAGHGVCADPTVRRFHLTAAQQMIDAGMLRLYLLRIGDRPVAAYYGFAAKRTAYAYLSGFDPDCAELSPGAQIVGHAIEEAIREGVREFHFLRGGEAYKYAWGAIDRPNTALTLRRRC